MNRLVIDNVTVATYDPKEELVSLVLQLADFRDLGARRGSFSRTLEVPGNPTTDALFAHLYSVTSTGSFDRNAAHPAYVESDGLRVFEGVAFLRAATAKVSYKLVLAAANADWITLAKERNLRDLTLPSEVFNAANVEASWTNNGDTAQHVYPLIDYFGQFAGFTSGTNVAPVYLRPALFVKPLVQQLLADLNLTLAGTFFKRREIRDLIIHFCQGTLRVSDAEREKQKAQATGVGPQALSASGTFPADLTAVVYDAGGNVSLANDTYTCPLDGTYTVRYQGTFEATATTWQSQSAGNVFVQVLGSSAGIVTQYGAQFIPYLSNGKMLVKFDLRRTYDFFQGETLRGQVNLNFSTVGFTYTQLELRDVTFTVTPVALKFGTGVAVRLADALPDMAQLDLLRNLIQAFNLYVVTDQQTNQVLVETRDDFFYGPENGDDWRDLLDTSKEITLENIEDGLARRLRFRYKDNKGADENVAAWDAAFRANYAEHVETLANEFLRDEQVVADLSFAPGWMRRRLSDHCYVMQTGSGEGRDSEHAPRLLIYNGLQLGAWTFDNVAKATYPEAAFVAENPTLAQLNLLFGNLRQVPSLGPELDDVLQQDNTGLVETFWRSTLRQINEGRLLTCFLRLDDEIVRQGPNLFRRPKLLRLPDGSQAWFLLNKVEDYKVGANQSSRVELLELI